LQIKINKKNNIKKDNQVHKVQVLHLILLQDHQIHHHNLNQIIIEKEKIKNKNKNKDKKNKKDKDHQPKKINIKDKKEIDPNKKEEVEAKDVTQDIKIQENNQDIPVINIKNIQVADMIKKKIEKIKKKVITDKDNEKEKDKDKEVEIKTTEEDTDDQSSFMI
jgi:hypothetical protein